MEDFTKREVQKGHGRVVPNLQKVPLQVIFQCPHRVCCSDFFTTMRFIYVGPRAMKAAKETSE